MLKILVAGGLDEDNKELFKAEQEFTRYLTVRSFSRDTCY